MVKPYFKPLDRPDREETWYCYFCPRKSTDQVETSPRNAMSQVPDLNMGLQPKDDVAEPQKPCRWRIKELDSSYVKLAKSGGHKNLLQFADQDSRSKEAKSYPVPDWYPFNDDTVRAAREKDEQRRKDLENIGVLQAKWYSTLKHSQTGRGGWPDWLNHEPHKALERSTRQPGRPIMGFDNLSAWKREELERMPPVARPKKSKENAGGKVQLKSKDSKLKLPKPQPPGQSKLGGSDYVTRWYDKWYVKAAL